MEIILIFNTNNYRLGYLMNRPNERKIQIRIPLIDNPRNRGDWEIKTRKTLEGARDYVARKGYDKAVDPQLLLRKSKKPIYVGDYYDLMKSQILESARRNENGEK